MKYEIQTPNGREFDLLGIAARIWDRRSFLVGCMVIGMLFGVFLMKTSQYRYSAKLSVIPAQSISGANSSTQVSSGLSALAALAGAGGSQQATPFILYLKSFTLRSVADRLAADPIIMRHLYGSQWDAQNQRWRAPDSWTKPVTTFIRGLLGIPLNTWQPPSGNDVQDFITGHVTVTTDTQSPVATVEFDDADPQFAVYFLKSLNHAVDTIIRRQALQRATANIAYLSTQLETVTNADHQQVLTETLSQQEQFRMMASSNVAYAADVFDGPVASARPVTPRPLYLLLGSIFGALLLGMPFALLFPNWTWLHWGRSLRARLLRPQASSFGR